MTRINPYGRRVRCLQHDLVMTGRTIWRTTGNHYVLLCPAVLCPNSDLPASRVDEAIGAEIGGTIEHMVAAAGTQSETRVKASADRLRTQLTRLEQQRAALRRARRQTLDKRGKTVETELELHELLQPFDARLMALDAKVDQIQRQSNRLHVALQHPQELLTFFRDAQARLRTASPEQRKALLDDLVRRIDISQRRVVTVTFVTAPAPEAAHAP